MRTFVVFFKRKKVFDINIIQEIHQTMDKEQFDEFLGGTVELPRDVQIIRLAAARATEIAAMTYSIENPQQSKLVFQKLPVHMRRRVMSHNAKRMPRRLREAHLRQMIKSGLPPKSKRRSRKYRRRPRNLLEEYNRRKGRCKWLETHIWHAKRFRMIEKWGYKIGDCPNDKSFRACYRAAAKHCLLQDVSYYNCVEIRGPEDILKETLKEHCNPGNLSFGAKIYEQGSREGNVMFFKKNGYPHSPIGNVKFLWKSGDTKFRTIWIWTHPLIYKDLLKQVVDSFKFNEKTLNTYENGKNCSMTNLSDSLNRFRLTGPLSLAILTDALRPPNFSSVTKTFSQNEMEKIVPMDVDNCPGSTSEWHETFYHKSENLEAFDVQRGSMDALASLKSPNQLPPNCVIAMTVLDPRFFLPDKRTKKLANTEYYAKILLPGNLADRSPLWDPEMRIRVKKSCKSANDIDKLRSENLVPGVANDDKFDENVISKVPVILIQNPGCNGGKKSIGFGSGIDVIIPAGWAMPFWQSFVLRCARAGGLGESRSMALEKLDIDSPETHQPDIASYAKEALTAMNELRAKYFRYPPNRRVNFTKFAISSPFYCEWSILMREWTDSEKFYVLRDRKLLEILERALSRNGRGIPPIDVEKSSSFDEIIFPHRGCLVPVKISLQGKGRPKNFAVICTPTSQDLETRGAKKNWSGPVQKFMADPNERRRKELRKNHKIMLKRSNRRGYRWRKLAQEAANVLKLEKRRTVSKSLKVSIERNFALKKDYREKMEEFYLPKCERVRDSCDRQIMGYVIRGDFSFSEARGIGMGYVTLDSLRNIIDSCGNLVLVRNTQTRQYRFARIEILDRYG